MPSYLDALFPAKQPVNRPPSGHDVNFTRFIGMTLESHDQDMCFKSCIIVAQQHHMLSRSNNCLSYIAAGDGIYIARGMGFQINSKQQ